MKPQMRGRRGFRAQRQWWYHRIARRGSRWGLILMMRFVSMPVTHNRGGSQIRSGTWPRCPHSSMLIVRSTSTSGGGANTSAFRGVAMNYGTSTQVDSWMASEPKGFIYDGGLRNRRTLQCYDYGGFTTIFAVSGP
ncbi:MAG: hypothetical protein RMM98_18305, partial [Acidobacteriota bacterium]|nr:hypothetical protein [Acidobacteriota bacterium]